jgi:hypothetical protein
MRTFRRISVLLLLGAIGCDVGGSATRAPAVAISKDDAGDREPADSSAQGGDREKIENPQYKSWAGFKPGTTVVHRTVTEATGNDGKTVTTSTYKLVELTADKAVVEVQNSTRRYDGHEANNPPEKFTHRKYLLLPPGVKKDGVGKPAGVTEEGEEIVRVGGNEYKAKWYRGKDRNEAGAMLTQVWSCPDMPGGLVRSVTDTPAIGKKTTTEVVEIRLP